MEKVHLNDLKKGDLLCYKYDGRYEYCIFLHVSNGGPKNKHKHYHCYFLNPFYSSKRLDFLSEIDIKDDTFKLT